MFNSKCSFSIVCVKIYSLCVYVCNQHKSCLVGFNQDLWWLSCLTGSSESNFGVISQMVSTLCISVLYLHCTRHVSIYTVNICAVRIGAVFVQYQDHTLPFLLKLGLKTSWGGSPAHVCPAMTDCAAWAWPLALRVWSGAGFLCQTILEWPPPQAVLGITQENAWQVAGTVIGMLSGP